MLSHEALAACRACTSRKLHQYWQTHDAGIGVVAAVVEGRHGASCSAAATSGAGVLAQPLEPLQKELQPLLIQGTCSEEQGRCSGARCVVMVMVGVLRLEWCGSAGKCGAVPSGSGQEGCSRQ